MDKNDIEKLDEIITHLEEVEDVRLENHAHKDSEGLGDTVEKVLSSFGITEAWIASAMGIRGCGCQKRKKFLNQIFPYRKQSKNHNRVEEE
jgi:hypothetical protein